MLKHCIISISFFNLLISMETPIRLRPISVCGSYDHMNLERRNDPTWTDLHDAAYHCTDINALKCIVEQTLRAKNTVDLPDKFGQTPLWWAVHNGKKNAVELLLQYGASVGHTDMFKRSIRSKMEANPTLKPLLNQGFKP